MKLNIDSKIKLKLKSRHLSTINLRMSKSRSVSAKSEKGASAAWSLLALYERMLLIRECELRLAERFNDGKIPGFIHLSVGQEAIAVGVAAALRAADTIASTHRGHGHGLAKGMSPEDLFQEISGNQEGPCRGRGGSLHVADFAVGMLGANGIVGGGIPIAVGSALAHAQLRNGNISAVFFGDGALAEGVLYESMNLAAIKHLPVLFVCENNGWSEFSPIEAQYAGSIEKLSSTFDMPFQRVDGNDVEAVHAASLALTQNVRAGQGPAVLECITLRVKGHYEGDPQVYRKGTQETRPSCDPLSVTRARLGAASQDQISEIDARVKAVVDSAARSASLGTRPSFDEATEGVYA